MNRPRLLVVTFALLLLKLQASIRAEDRPQVPAGLLDKQLDVSLEGATSSGSWAR